MKLKNSALQELYDTVVNGTITISPYEASPIDKAFKECDEKLSESITFAHVKNLQDRNDILEGSNKALLEANLESISKTRKIEKDLDDAKKQLNYFTHSRDDWRDRAKHAEKDLDDAKEQLKATQKNFDELYEESKQISEDKQRVERSRVLWALKAAERGKKLYEAERKNEDLASQYQKLTIENKRLLDSTRNDGYEQGQKNLWDKLQEVSDYYYFGGDDEFDTDDCEMTSMTDIIDNLNVDQFLEAYKNWHKAQEQHRWEYEPIARRLSQPWECTLEGTINAEINKDLLKKVFGIDSDD